MTTGRRLSSHRFSKTKFWDDFHLRHSTYKDGKRRCKAYAICTLYLLIVAGGMLAAKPYGMTHGNGLILLLILITSAFVSFGFYIRNHLRLKHLSKIWHI